MLEMIKIGILKETKIPVDNRVALSPKQIIELQRQYPNVQVYIQTSDIRCYKDEEYSTLGIPVVEDISECDILLGVKEVDITTLLPNKYYIFFGHIAKEQPYNKPLIKKMIEQKITFSDYEYFIDDKKQRLCAFGWWAGVVGAYNTIRAYGIKSGNFILEKPHKGFTLENLKNNLYAIKHLCNTSVIITGNGRVSQGAQFVMKQLDAQFIEVNNFKNNKPSEGLTYTVLKTEDLVKHKDCLPYNSSDFKENGQNYISRFQEYAQSAEILISCHFWKNNQPVYVNEDVLKDTNRSIKVIGDITCDIMGSIKSTIRPSTHDEPFYDFNPNTMKEEEPFSHENNITVMAVDTCPNALALDTSKYFGEMLVKHILPALIEEGLENTIIRNATILEKGKLTDSYMYLKTYADI